MVVEWWCVGEGGGGRRVGWGGVGRGDEGRGGVGEGREKVGRERGEREDGGGGSVCACVRVCVWVRVGACERV